MPLPVFPTDAYGNETCPKCNGYIVPMEYPDETEGVRCRCCGKGWFIYSWDGKHVGNEETLPIFTTNGL